MNNNNKKVTPQEVVEEYLENYSDEALSTLRNDVAKMNRDFDIYGYTSEELSKLKAMKEALNILKDYE